MHGDNWSEEISTVGTVRSRHGDQFEDPNLFEDALGHSWKSATVVTNLHKAYKRCLRDNGELKDTLKQSEQKFKEFLTLQKENVMVISNHKNGDSLESQVLDLQNLVKRLEDKIEIHANRESEFNEQKDAMNNTIQYLQESFHRSSQEKTSLTEDMSLIRQELTSKKIAVERMKGSAIKSLFWVLKRWFRSKIQAAFNTWIQKSRMASSQLAENAHKEHIVRKFVARFRMKDTFSRFAMWKDFTLKSKHHKTRLLGVVRRMKRIRISQVFDAWTEFVSLRNFLKSFCSRMLGRIINSSMAAAFWTWNRHTMEATGLLNVHQVSSDLVTLQMQFAAQFESIELLKKQHAEAIENVKQQNKTRLEGLAVRSIQKMQHQRLGALFTTFVERVHDSKIKRGIYFFNKWHDNATESLLQHRRLAKCITLFTQRRLASSFRGWVTNMEELVMNRRKIERFVLKMQNISVFRMFAGWNTYVVNKVSLRRKASRLIAIIQNDTCRFSFNQWREFVIENKTTKDSMVKEESILDKFARKWKYRQAAKVLQSWKMFTEERQFLRRLMKRALRSSADKKKFAAFFAWRDNAGKRAMVSLGAQLEMQHQMIVQLQDTLKHLAEERDNLKLCMGSEIDRLNYQKVELQEKHKSKVILWWQHKNLRGAFSLFTANARQLIHQRHLLESFSTRLQMIKVSKSLRTWADFATNRKFLRRILNLFVSGKIFRNLDTGFRTWQVYSRGAQLSALNIQTESDKEKCVRLEHRVSELEWEHEALKSKYGEELNRTLSHHEKIRDLHARKVIGAMRNNLLHNCFITWKDMAVTIITNRVIVARFRGRFMNSLLSKSFNGWLSNIWEVKRNRGLVTRFAAQMQSRTLVMSFRSWKDNAAEISSNRAKVSKFLMRQLNSCLWRLFSRWNDFTVHSIQVKQRASGIFVALSQDHISWRFDCWREYTTQMKGERREMMKHECIVKKVLIRMHQRATSKSFEAWSDVVATRRTNRMKMSKFVKQWQMNKLSRIFRNWIDNVEDMQYSRKIIYSTLTRLSNRKVYACFRMWTLYVRTDLSQQLDQQQTEIAALKLELSQRDAERRMLENQFGDELREALAQNQAVKEKIFNSFLVKVMRQSMYKAFHCWVVRVGHSKQQKIRVKRFLGNMMHVTTRKAFSTWSEAKNKKLQLRLCARKVICKMNGNSMARVFTAWREFSTEQKDQEKILERLWKMLQRILHSKKFRAWHAWLTLVQEMKLTKMEAMVLNLNEERRKLGLSLSKVQESYATKAIASIRNPLLMRVLLTWRVNVNHLRVQKTRIKNLIFRMEFSSVGSSFRAWTSLTSKGNQRRHATSSLVLKWSKHLVNAAFITWTRKVRQQDSEEIEYDAKNALAMLFSKDKNKVSKLKCMHDWHRFSRLEKAKRTAGRLFYGVAQRLLMRKLVPAYNQWKLNTFAENVKLVGIQNEESILRTFRIGVDDIVSKLILGCIYAEMSGYGDTDKRIHIRMTRANHQPTWNEPAENDFWYLLNANLSSQAPLLSNSDSVHCLQLEKDHLICYDKQGVARRRNCSGITGSAAKNGQMISTVNARSEPRFDQSIDELASDNTFSTTSLSKQYLNSHSTNRLAMVCIPVEDYTTGDVLGVLQASKTLGESVESPHYLEMVVGTLQLASEIIALEIHHRRNLSYLVSECSEQRRLYNESNAECVQLLEDTQIQQASLAHLTTLNADMGSKIDHMNKELLMAHKKIGHLEEYGEHSNVVEREVKQILMAYDNSMSSIRLIDDMNEISEVDNSSFYSKYQ